MSATLVTWNVRQNKVVAAFSTPGQNSGANIRNWANKRQLMVVPDTVSRISDGPFGTVVAGAVLMTVRQTRQATQANVSQMSKIANNLFIDANESVWKEEGGMLVRQQNETTAYLEELMATAHDSNHVTASESPRIAEALRKRYDGQPAEANTFGLVLAGRQSFVGTLVATSEDGAGLVLPFDAHDPESSQPVEVVANDILDLRQFQAFGRINGRTWSPRVEATSVEGALDYYRKVYGRWPEYFAKVSEIIRQSWKG
jgi:hypothetical protein